MSARSLVGYHLICLTTLLTLCCAAPERSPDAGNTPAWVRTAQPISSSDIPQTDHPYLTEWIEANSGPAEEYFLGLFERHQVVIFGEAHMVREHKEFLLKLIPRLYHEAGVRCIGWEFSRHSANQRLQELTTAPQIDREAVLKFARSQSVEWNSKEHWDFIEAVRQLNSTLKPDQQRMRLIGLEKDWDQTRYWIVTKTTAPDSPEYQEMLSDVLERDRVMAEQVGKEIIEKGEKGLVFVGRAHDFTHYEFPADVNFGREIMGNLLWKEYGDRVFQVWPSIGMLSFVEGILEDRSADASVGFDLFASPFAKVLSPARFPDAPGVPLERLARGYIYFGPRSELHNNTSIEGYVTDEMFSQHRRYYEIDFGRPFRDGAEVDAYLQAHRWPQP